MTRIESARRLAAFVLADAVMGHLPRRVSYAAMTVIGWIVATVFPGRVRGLASNLRQVFPEYSDAQVTDLMQRNAKNYGKFWVDLFKMPRIPAVRRNALAVVENQASLESVMAAGRGVVIVSIHMGGWEGCASLWGSKMAHIRSGLIAEVLEPPALWRRILRLRESTGLEIIPLSRTAPRDIIRRLRANGLVCGAIDRDLLGSGKPFQFFGRPASIPTGLFEVAQRTGAGVLPVVCLRHPGDTYSLVGMEPIWIGPEDGAVDAAVNQALRVFEDCIRRYPDQWHVMEPIWAPAEAADEAAAAPSAAVRVFPAGAGEGADAELGREAGVG
ncbi:MAG: phosphatidylinositol dimannoside acyltransferase [Chloroflexota bacterium]|nr:phosphatidylinositol dimannoside acyltransferase [Chloroflexota bacterium]